MDKNNVPKSDFDMFLSLVDGYSEGYGLEIYELKSLHDMADALVQQFSVHASEIKQRKEYLKRILETCKQSTNYIKRKNRISLQGMYASFEYATRQEGVA